MSVVVDLASQTQPQFRGIVAAEKESVIAAGRRRQPTVNPNAIIRAQIGRTESRIAIEVASGERHRAEVRQNAVRIHGVREIKGGFQGIDTGAGNSG